MSLEENNDVERRRATPVTPYYSYLLIACLVAVFIAQIAIDPQGGLLIGGSKSAQLAGFVKSAFRNGEYWRILTSGAVHGGIIHLMFNSYALYVLGKLIETLSNRAHLGIIFLVSAIGGNIMSLALAPNSVPSVGASGGIIGFLGYLTIYGFRRRGVLSSQFLKNMLFNIGFIALYGISLYKVIDNFGHLGGLIAGAIYGVFQIPADLHEDPRDTSEPMQIAGMAAIGFFAFVSVLTVLFLFQLIKH